MKAIPIGRGHYNGGADIDFEAYWDGCQVKERFLTAVKEAFYYATR